MDRINYKKTKYTCYFTYLAMAAIFSLPPLLFAAFRELYGISYTLLGTLVLVNFCSQLGIDLIFSFFSRFFNIHKTVRLMPVLTAAGLTIYALIPTFFPQFAYVGLLIGTFLFSVSAGLGEVLISPTVAALPSDNPERDMSALHSLYGYGFVGVVVISTLFLQLFGRELWMLLALFWAIPPMIAFILLMRCQLPDMEMGKQTAHPTPVRKRITGLLLCMACIFLGACAENTMSNWISAFTENALHIPKAWGDILGMSMFALLLALTRTAYAKYGKSISKTLLISMSGSVVCYLAVAFSPNAIVSLIACVALGICTSMLWPGTLIYMEENLPAVGVAAYALMAAGGDFGAAFAPQGMGIVVDRIALTDWAGSLAAQFSLNPVQIGFKVGMLLTAILPLLGIFLILWMKRYFRKQKQ